MRVFDCRRKISNTRRIEQTPAFSERNPNVQCKYSTFYANQINIGFHAQCWNILLVDNQKLLDFFLKAQKLTNQHFITVSRVVLHCKFTAKYEIKITILLNVFHINDCFISSPLLDMFKRDYEIYKLRIHLRIKFNKYLCII